MAKYQKNTETVEAAQWSKVGDHAAITVLSVSSEAKGKEICTSCGRPMSAHGMRDLDGRLYDTICPGRWIITHEDGRIEYLDDAAFQKMFTAVEVVEG